MELTVFDYTLKPIPIILQTHGFKKEMKEWIEGKDIY